MTAKQTAAAEVTIQVDCEGTKLGNLNDDSDPLNNHIGQTDGWMLAHKTPTGTTAYDWTCTAPDPTRSPRQSPRRANTYTPTRPKQPYPRAADDQRRRKASNPPVMGKRDQRRRSCATRCRPLGG